VIPSVCNNWSILMIFVFELLMVISRQPYKRAQRLLAKKQLTERHFVDSQGEIK
jgi:hypothetical protein